MNRNDVFLEAMGLGPQWRLRHGPAVVGGETVADGAMADAIVAGESMAADGVIPAPAAGMASMAAAPTAPSMPPASPNSPQSSMSASGGATAGYAAPAMRGPDVLPDSPQPAAPAGAGAAPPVASPPARAVSQGTEDTSWFDDAPAAPSARPALKSPAPAKAAPPARPPANGGAASGTGDADGDSYAWFDAVPATPLAKPPRQGSPEREAMDGESAGREFPRDDSAAAGRAAPRGASSGREPWRETGGPAGRAPQAAQRPGRPPQSAFQAAPAPDGMPDDGVPWFDDAPPPSFDAAFDGLYGGDGHYGQEEQGVSDAAIARMDWPALRAAVQTCTRCPLGRERAAAVPGRGPEQAPWLVLAAAPDADDEAQQRALAGAPGQLLDNMLKAINVAPEGDAYVTTLVKCRARDGRAPSGDELSACRPYLERELALAGSRAIVTLGHTAAKGLLGAAARGKVLRLEQIPVVATYHPADLLRKPDDKARAWADLCLARAAFDGRA